MHPMIFPGLPAICFDRPRGRTLRALQPRADQNIARNAKFPVGMLPGHPAAIDDLTTGRPMPLQTG
jgi:hypothetical protein